MKKVYLITIPSDKQGVPAVLFVTDDIKNVTGKYPVMMIQQVDFISNELS